MAQSGPPCSWGPSLDLWGCWRRVRLWGEVGLGILEEEHCREAETLGNNKESLDHGATHLSSWPVEPCIWALFQGISAFEQLPNEAMHLSGCSMEPHIWLAPCHSHAFFGLTHLILLPQVWHTFFFYFQRNQTRTHKTDHSKAKAQLSCRASLLASLMETSTHSPWQHFPWYLWLFQNVIYVYSYCKHLSFI